MFGSFDLQLALCLHECMSDKFKTCVTAVGKADCHLKERLQQNENLKYLEQENIAFDVFVLKRVIIPAIHGIYIL